MCNFNFAPELNFHLCSYCKQRLPGMQQSIWYYKHKINVIMWSNTMLHSLIITLIPWLPTHTAPMDIVSVSVTSCLPPECVCLHSLMYTNPHIMDGRENADRVILSAITAGLLEEWTPITANQTEPNPASVHQPPLHPAATTPDTPFSLPGSVVFPLVIAVR